MRSYETARSLFSFLGVCAWGLIILGVIVAIAGAGAASGISSFGRSASGLAVFMASVPGLVMSLVGVFSLALVENGRAAVDTAELTQQMLKVARDQLEVSRQALKQGEQVAQNYEALKQASASAHERPAASYSEALAVDEKPNGQDAAVAEEVKQSLEYAGHTLELHGEEVRFGTITFNDLESAKRYIDENGSGNRKIKLGGVTRDG